MDADLNREELHRYYDRMAGGICLIRADRTEKILFVNARMPELYGCSSEEEFMRFCGGTFKGMVEEQDYYSLPDLKAGREDTKIISFHFRNRADHFRYAEGPIKRLSMEGVGDVLLLQIFPAEEIRSTLKADELTGLPGMHDFFNAALEEQKKRIEDNTAAELCPISFNVANFREFNRVYGVRAGDRCLKEIADVLKETFPGDLIGHFPADTFAGLVSRDQVMEKAEHVCERINTYIHNDSIALKAGLVLLRDEDVDREFLTHTFDMAKIACDSIKTDSTRSVAVYTEEMGIKLQQRSFVITNFDEALAKGHIKVFFQPIVRTLSGRLCGCEALARWEDPQRGMLSPSVFIPILEDARLIARLDAYVIEWVARLIHDRMSTGLPPIPVSFNLSRLDFDLMNPLEVIEQAVYKYNIPKDSLRIEITERVMAWNRQNLVRILREFHNAGYQVWLDDFGSEYSSLNTLHYYQFDVLKIDMEFFRNFDETSRKIIASVVKMSGLLGVHTLAEGVENQEQLDFLRKIGCGKIQGFYYGKPMRYEDCIAAWSRQKLELESPLEAKMFYASELVDVMNGAPTGIFELREGKPMLLYVNDPYLKVLQSINTEDMKSANWNLSSFSYPMQNKLRSFLEKVFDSEKTEQMVYVDNGQFIRLRARKIAGIREYWIGKAEIRNISVDQDYAEGKSYDRILRNILLLYDGLYYLNTEMDQIEIIECVHPRVKVGGVFHHIQKSFRQYADELVYQDDRQRFLSFIDLEHIYAEAARSGRSHAASIFRIKREDGTYRWTVFDAIVLYKSKNHDILLCEREDLWERIQCPQTLQREFFQSFRLPEKDLGDSFTVEKGILRALVRDSDIKLFWKDKDRRFLGASDAFLRFHNILDPEELIGKTNEEMGWRINEYDIYHNEESVLQHGKIIRNSIGSCMVDGQPHTISSTEFPFYKKREVCGVVGYFRDLQEVARDEEQAMIDPESGYLNFYGLLMAGLQYADDCRLRNIDYTGVLFFVEEFASLSRAYGETFSKDLSRHIIQAIDEKLPENVTFGHIGIGCFLLLCSGSEQEHIHETAAEIAASIRKITEVSGCKVSMYMQYSMAFGSEVRSFDTFLLLLIERLHDAEKQHYGENAYSGDRIILWKSSFDTLPDQVYVSDPETYELVYLNQSARKVLHLSDQFSCRGEKCYEVLEGRDAPCGFCAGTRLTSGSFLTETHRNRKTGQDLLSRSILFPWKDKNLRLTISSNLSKYAEMNIERNELVYHEAKANDAIAIGMQERDPNQGIRKMLIKIADNLHADRIMIFEEREKDMFSCTYEWGRANCMPLKNELQGIPKSGLMPLYQKYEDHHVVLIEDYRAFCSAEPEFHLPISGIQNLVSGQLQISGKPIGFSLVINCSEDTFTTARLLLSTLTNFVAIMLRNRDTLLRIEEQSVRDPLTGALNRRGLEQYLNGWSGNGSLSLISGDINGLKNVNDTMGHHEGDLLICSAADVLMRHADRDHVFRTGGDEFLLIAENISEAETRSLIAKIKNEGRGEGLSLALGYTRNVGAVENIDQLLTEADRRMYEDKGQTYRRRWDDPPTRRNQ